MIAIPAIDLREGRVVRLFQGDYAQETRYAQDPVALAQHYADAGARWLHLVDLDGARQGGSANLAVIEAIAAITGLQLQCGGGVRSEADYQRLRAAGVKRVVIGSLAVREPERVAAWGQRDGSEAICLALDARADAGGVFRVHTAGWEKAEALSLDEALAQFGAQGFRHMLVTDIDRDGTLQGPNLQLYAQLRAQFPQLALIASGGIRELGDLIALRELGMAAVVIGKALLEGRFTVEEALKC